MEARFCGFAYSQLCRIKKFCSLQQQDEWEIGHLKKSIELSMENLNRMLPLENSRLVLEQEDEKLYLTGSFKKVPMDDVESIFHTIHSVNQSFHSLGAKNKKEGDRKLSKHMLNLIRLYAMGIDVLKHGKIITYREKEHDLLMDIRNNRFVKDMTVDPSFFELAEKYSQEFEEARKNTKIPDKPDWNEIEKLTMFFNRESLKM